MLRHIYQSIWSLANHSIPYPLLSTPRLPVKHRQWMIDQNQTPSILSPTTQKEIHKERRHLMRQSTVTCGTRSRSPRNLRNTLNHCLKFWNHSKPSGMCNLQPLTPPLIILSFHHHTSDQYIQPLTAHDKKHENWKRGNRPRVEEERD